jgi:hypothetical protein
MSSEPVEKLSKKYGSLINVVKKKGYLMYFMCSAQKKLDKQKQKEAEKKEKVANAPPVKPKAAADTIDEETLDPTVSTCEITYYKWLLICYF